MSSTRVWLQACFDFAHAHGIEERDVDALHAFAYPNPRGGPPPPPEARFEGDFEALEQHLCSMSLEDAMPRDAMIENLAAEVDPAQAEIFARRIAAVERQLIALDDATGRLLRVGLRQRLHGILAAPRPRALRVRAVADYYYSYAGRWLHARASDDPPRPLGPTLHALPWVSVFDGGELATIEGVFAGGPVHAHVLRVRPGTVRAQVVDCRDAVEQRISFGDYVRERGAIAAVSGGFFLYSEPDIVAPARRFDPVGLLIGDGHVHSPPTFARGSLLFDSAGAWSVERCGPQSVRMRQGDLDAGLDAIVTRAQAERGPDEPSVAVEANTVVAVGRSLAVPLSGFVLSDPRPWRVGAAVTFSAPRTRAGAVVRDGVAGGPLLLRDGQPCLDLRAEGFWGTAPPLTFSQDETGDRNTLPRLAAGVDAQGRLVLAAIDGRNFRRALGMTLEQVSALMQGLGCVSATNLDGGSSKRMVVGGRTLDLASTEVEQHGVATVPGSDRVRPVHTAVLLHLA